MALFCCVSSGVTAAAAARLEGGAATGTATPGIGIGEGETGLAARTGTETEEGRTRDVGAAGAEAGERVAAAEDAAAAFIEGRVGCF